MNTGAQSRLIVQLYTTALSLREEERAHFLDEHCEDPAVREQVESMFVGEATKKIPSTPGQEQLAEGSLLNHYRIGPKLGAGGMGVVYKAFDEQLQRTVALKIMSPGRTDEEARRRFMREAQSSSVLNHPSIVAVYDVGREAEMDYIVFEYVEGRTLRDSIRGRALDASTAIRYAAQIADALAAAHDAGIVHRDLKPGNIIITDRDAIKVLDFGLAKQSAGFRGAATETSLTEPGYIVGTAAYMSPEQAEAQAVDARSDIFSFGALLYEMITGNCAFERPSGIATMAAILNEHPTPLEQAAPTAPAALRYLIGKCLEKKPYDRWQSMHDVKLVLDHLLDDCNSPAPSTPSASSTPSTSRRSSTLWLPIVVASGAAVIAAAATLLFTRQPTETPEPEPVYSMLTNDKGLSDYPGISKDGKFIAFASDRGGQDHLDIWLQQIGGQDPIRLTNGPADKMDPAFSPDGTKVAFRSEKDGGGIYVMPALGGEPVLIATSGRNPRFSPDGRFVAYWTGRGEGSEDAGSGQVFIVEAGGGQPRAVHEEMSMAKYPVWSPAGDKLLVLGWTGSSSRDWWALPLDNGSPQKTGGMAEFKRRGFVRSVYSEQQPIDWTETSVLFAALLGDSANLWESNLGPAAVSKLKRRTRGPGYEIHASRAITNDYERLAFSNDAINYNVWTVGVDALTGRSRGEMTRLTDTLGTQWAPSLDAAGRVMTYISARVGSWAVRLSELDRGRDRTLYSSHEPLISARISGDARTIVATNVAGDMISLLTTTGAMKTLCKGCGTVTGVSFDGNEVLYEPLKDENLMSLDVRNEEKHTITRRPNAETLLSGGEFSNDGKWAAFHAARYLKRTTQVFVVRVDRSQPAPASEWIAITDGSTFAQNPSWGPHDNVLYFVSERDGFRCYWAQELDPKTKAPIHEPFALQHLHTARRTLRGTSSTGYLVAPSFGGDRVAFSFPEITGNIWLEDKRRPR